MKIKEAIIVEGIYDKITLSGIFDALVVPTYGFSVFTDEALLAYIRSLAEKTGIIILMDSDAAGFKIRSFLTERIKTGTVRHAYIPTVQGKEKRKARPSKEGTLGVEGQTPEILLEALRAVSTEMETDAQPITNLDFYEDGLSGKDDSTKMRALLSSHLSLPPRLSGKALLSAVNALMTREEYKAFINRCR